jgi:hypothetical protein
MPLQRRADVLKEALDPIATHVAVGLSRVSLIIRGDYYLAFRRTYSRRASIAGHQIVWTLVHT